MPDPALANHPPTLSGMNTLLLQPTDVLFFRDGRPMEGSLAGHGAAWPLPTVTDSALHAALHRSGLDGHRHDHIATGQRSAKDVRQFGSLVSAGPFPVQMPAERSVETSPTWYFPCPRDLLDGTLEPALAPARGPWSAESSLPTPLRYAVGSRVPPSKETAKANPTTANAGSPQPNKRAPWISGRAVEQYLRPATVPHKTLPDSGVDDGAIFDSEAAVGIAIDPETATTGQGSAQGAIYAAHYLRLREHWRLGVLASTAEKNSSSRERDDLIGRLLDPDGFLLIGGQQRSCTAVLEPRTTHGRLPLPLGRQDGFPCDVESGSRSWRVKWVLLSPAIWPEIQAAPDIMRHSGGWLPNWIDGDTGQVRLKSGDTSRPSGMSREAWRKHVQSLPSIEASLVAAVVAKPLPVTGWASAHEAAERPDGGAKSTLLAVPAGSIYYFEAPSEAAANNLAQALNWHGTTAGTAVRNRRSTLLGEKGFGLGVCGTWDFFPGRPR